MLGLTCWSWEGGDVGLVILSEKKSTSPTTLRLCSSSLTEGRLRLTGNPRRGNMVSLVSLEKEVEGCLEGNNERDWEEEVSRVSPHPLSIKQGEEEEGRKRMYVM